MLSSVTINCQVGRYVYFFQFSHLLIINGIYIMGIFFGHVMSQKVSINRIPLCLFLCLCHCVCLFVGQDMSLHHSDQMSERSEENYIVFLYVN